MTDLKPLHDAIAATMVEVRRLEKADSNAFARYKFTSVDDYKDHLRPIMAKHGLSVSVSETEYELIEIKAAKDKEGTRTAVKVTFGIRLHHGGVSTDPDFTTVVLDLTGAQTTGAARSYALKEWLKSRFMASSGDIEEDADSHATAEYSGRPINKTTGRPMYEKRDGKLIYAALCKEMREVTHTEAEVRGWWKQNLEKIATLPPEWKDYLKADCENQIEGFKLGDEEPVNPIAAG